jgi:putative protein kinase ArgK-like GTPase of G3E family
LQKLAWKGPAFMVSAATGEGTVELAQAVMRELERMKQEEVASEPLKSEP